MRILSISAQKPLATGSGVYLTEVMNALARMGHEQALVAGIYAEDRPVLPDGVLFAPVFFRSEALPFPIVGMSDEMPYPSTRYRDMTPEMVAMFREAFLARIGEVVSDFHPDLILCHHLYLLCALVRERFPEHVVCGFCHNTDLRQMIKTDLDRDFIITQIRRLDKICALHHAQADEIVRIFGVSREQITVIGTGYDHAVFRRLDARPHNAETVRAYHASHDARAKHLIYVGKIAEKKGVLSLLHALERLTVPPDALSVSLIGGAGNETEYAKIKAACDASRYSVSMPGRVDTDTLVRLYNESDVFVLPSFSEGLPLVVIEALACGLRVVVTDLPGLRDFYSANVTGGDIRYVTPPLMHNADEVNPDDLSGFEDRLAKALSESLQNESASPADVSALTWDAVADRMLSAVRHA
ncbi:MAG: glycosyltransferase family 4 protein [Lachnospiraceae bacterium]|nr:glycosyltransferase family 4 protein [Lachnospiraceae bacterium]